MHRARCLVMPVAVMVAIMACGLLACLAPTAHVAYAQDGYTAGIAASAADNTAGVPASSSVAKVVLNKKKVKIKNDGTFQFVATLVPDVAGGEIEDDTITWSISKPNVASVTQDGLVRGKKTGLAVVTAKAANGKKATAKVKVKVDKNKMAKAIPVLTYHRIASNIAKSRVYSGTNLAISASAFAQQMRWLSQHGYRTVSTAEFKDWRVNGAFLPKKSVLITMDDGFYEVYHIAYPILRKYNLKATSFVIGSKAGKKTKKYNPLSRSDHFVGWDVIKRIRTVYPNLEFQSHTYNMHHRNGSGNGVATSWSRKAIDRDFAKNKKFEFTSIAYPFGHTSRNLFSSVRSNKAITIGFGYMMDWPATRTSPRYNIPRFKVFGDRGLGDFVSIVRTAR